MNVLVYMIPVALALGGCGLAAFLWALNSGQFDDPDGAAARVLSDPGSPLPDQFAMVQRSIDSACAQSRRPSSEVSQSASGD